MKVHITEMAAADVYEVSISDHPTVKYGKPRRVAYCGPSGLGFIVEHFLSPGDQEEVAKFAKEAMAAKVKGAK